MVKLLSLRILLPLLLSGFQSAAQFNYPVARKESFDTVIYDQKISDPYFWMSRSANESEMLDFCSRQVSLTKSLLDSIPGTEALMNEWGDAYAAFQDELWSLKAIGTTIYYNRSVPDEGTWLCRRRSISGAEEKILSRVSINGRQYAIRKKVFAHTKPWVALMLTQRGEANPHIRIFDMDTKNFLPDSIGPVMFNDSRGVSMAWMPDDKGLLYTQAPPTNISSEKYYNGRIKLHIIGTDPQNDEAIFGAGVHKDIEFKDYETPYVYSFNHSPFIIARVRAGDSDNYAFAVHYTKDQRQANPMEAS